MAGDASFASVSTLLHADVAPLVDKALVPKSYIAAGSAAVSGTSKFGAGSMSFSNSTSYFYTPHHADFDFGTGALTIECWFRATTIAGNTRAIFAKSSATSGIVREIALYLSSTTVVTFYYGVRGSSNVTKNFTVPVLAVDTWYHLAFTRDAAGDMRVFIDGVQSSTGALNDATDLSGTLPIYFGALYAGAVFSPWDGYIDDLRVTKGVARYVTNFTAPTAPLIDGIAAVEGVVRDGAGTPAVRTVRLHDRDSGALIGAVQSAAGTGAYAIYTPTVSEVQRIVLDDAPGILLNDIIDRVIPA